MVFIKSLSESEAAALVKLMRTTRDVRLYQRAQVIWLSYQQKKVKEIAQIVGLTEMTVIRWIRRYEAEGLEGLKTRPILGRSPKVTPAYRRMLLELVRTSPRLVGYPVTLWTLELLAHYLGETTGIWITKERVRQLLQQEDSLHFRRSKRYPICHNDHDEKRQ